METMENAETQAFKTPLERAVQAIVEDILGDSCFGEWSLHEILQSLPEDHDLHKRIHDWLALENLAEVYTKMNDPVPAEILGSLVRDSEILAYALMAAENSGELRKLSETSRGNQG